MIYLDTETCGFHGMPIIAQYAEDDGPILIHNFWREPVLDSLRLISQIVNHPGGVCAFNIVFDWFHLCKIYTTLALCPDYEWLPEDHINEIAMLEPKGRDGQCLKPFGAIDLMLHARKGPYQSTMERDDIRIKRIPAILAEKLADELSRRIPLKRIYFAKSADPNERHWKVRNIEEDDGTIIPDLKDIVLSFKPSSALKALAIDALSLPIEETLIFADVSLPDKLRPVEYGFAPFATAGVWTKKKMLLKTFPGHWRGTWPDVIRHHIGHWAFNSLAQEYARKDVEYLRRLYKFFGCPPINDNDSILACEVAASRWRGYSINKKGISDLLVEAQIKAAKAPKAPEQARIYLNQVMDATEQLVIRKSTKKIILESVAQWTKFCPVCDNDDAKRFICSNCKGQGLLEHPAATRAQEILTARKSNEEAVIFRKLLQAGRFHASFVIIGTLSTRMAGADDLNPQGINKDKHIREQFPLYFHPDVLDGGDFDSFEVTLADAEYDDAALRADLKAGKKIHAILGSFFFDKSYDEVLSSDGSAIFDMYKRGKSGFFAFLYGGDSNTVQVRLGVPKERAEQGYQSFLDRYSNVRKSRDSVFNDFCSMRQPGGLGTAVEWHEPKDFVESLFGFRRYFTLENRICKALFELANKPPDNWKHLKVKVVRRDRVQTASGAVQSALYGAAFGIQAANMRAAANHRIQSSGAQITKGLQAKIWEIQPCGIHPWKVQPINIHDEIMTPRASDPEIAIRVKEAVMGYVESLRPKVPLIGMKWKQNLKSWADR